MYLCVCIYIHTYPIRPVIEISVVLVQGKCMSLNRQLENHQVTIARVARILGNQVSAVQLLNKCLYYVGMGSNDYLNNYFISEHYTTSKVHSVEEYAKALISQYSLQLRVSTTYSYLLFALIH